MKKPYQTSKLSAHQKLSFISNVKFPAITFMTAFAASFVGLLGLFLLLNPLNAKAEGTSTVSTSTINTALSILPDQNRGSYLGSSDDNWVYFRIGDHTTENFYYGFNWVQYSSTTSTLVNPPIANMYMRIFNPNGVQVGSPINLPTFGSGYISTFNQASIGANISGSHPGGYTPLSFNPTMNGEYHIEYYISNDGGVTAVTGGPPAQWAFSPFWDLQVATTTGARRNGRVHCSVWAFNAVNPSNFRTGYDIDAAPTVTAWSTDSTVLKFDFNPGFRPIAFDVAVTEYGTQNTNNYAVDRQSRNSAFSPILPNGYLLFVNPPDTNFYPSAPAPLEPELVKPITLSCGAPIDIRYRVFGDGDVRLLLDINGIPGYQDNSTDVILEDYGVSAGLNTIAWNGLDGQNNPVPSGQQFTLSVSYLKGRFNVPLYDAEINKNGFNITTLAPIFDPNVRLFWNDANLTNVGTTCDLTFAGAQNNISGTGLDNTRGGSVSPAHAWSGNGNPGQVIPAPTVLSPDNINNNELSNYQCDDYGNVRIINTYGWGASASDTAIIRLGCLTASGTVWFDKDYSGDTNNNNIFTPGEVGTLADTTLFATLVDPVTGTVIESVPVAANGTYNFTTVPAYGDNMPVTITNVQGTAGSPPPPIATLPAGWTNTSPLTQLITTDSVNLTGIDYGVVEPFETDPDFNVTWANVPVTGNVSTNDDIVPPGTTYGSPTAVPGNPDGSMPTLNSDGTYTFTSPVTGVFKFEVPVCPPGIVVPNCPIELLTITVLDSSITSNPPVANVDIASTPLNTPVTLNTLSNDQPGNLGNDLDPSTVTVVDSPNNGTVTVNPTTGETTYTPNPGFTGIDTLEYTVCDNQVPPKCASALQIIDVQPTTLPNSTVAADDYKTTLYNTPVSGNAMDNDSDPQGHNQTITPQTTTIPGKGTLVLDSNGVFTFTPVNGFIGPVEYPYTTCDNGTPVACAMATIHILVPGPIPPDTVTVTTDCPTCPSDPICATADDLPTGPGTTTYTTCGLSPSTMGTQVLNPTTGCIVFTGNGTQTPSDTVKSCVVACKNGVCDTTYINILTIVPDTVVTPAPPCLTCTLPPVCATQDDIDTTGGGTTYTTCGAPSGYTFTGPDANGCITLTGDGTADNVADTTCIVACNNGLCDTTVVIIPPPILPDTVTVTTDCPTCPSDPICATADDLPTGPGTTTYTTCGLSPSTMGTQVLNPTTGCIVFTGNGTQTPSDTVKSCVVACKNGVCDTTYINILTIVPDTVVTPAPSCLTCTLPPVCATQDDIDTTGGGTTYTTCGAPSGYTFTGPDANGCITLTGDGTADNVADTTCIVACNNGLCDTTVVIIPPPILPDTVTVTTDCPTCPSDPICATADDLPTGPGTTTYTTCGLSPSTMGTQVLNPTTGCIVFTGNGTQTPSDTVKSCVVACKNGVCDTTYINILTIVPDTVVTPAPSCLTCTLPPVCATQDDIDTTGGGTTYTTCGAPSGYTFTGPDANGCITLTGDGTADNVADTTCIVACNNGLCDTTVVIIPPPILPDTVTVTTDCPTCPSDPICATADDLPTGPGTTTYTTCGLSPSTMGTQVLNPTTGCIVFTGNGTQTPSDTVKSCVVACKNGVCDTTYINILTIVPDTVVTPAPSCLTCTLPPVCATQDDIDTTGGGTTYTTCGAPSGYTFTGPDANGCITLTGDGTADNVADTTCIVACNNGLCDTTVVIIPPPILPDTVTVTTDCPTCPSDPICATADDLPTGPGTTTYTTCGLSPSTMGTQVLNPTTGCIVFTGNGTQTPSDTVKSCVVACKNGVCDTTYINILTIVPDTVTVTPPCGTCPTDPICATADDLPTGPGTITYTTCGLSPSTMGTQVLNPTTGCIVFTGNGTQGPNDTVKSCVVACKNGLCDTTFINILPPVTPDTLVVTPPCGTCPTDPMCATANDLPTGPGTITYTTCGLSPTTMGTQVLDTLTGCIVFTGNGTQGPSDTVKSCVVACKNGVCDTTYINILPPINPDTVTVTTDCPTCPSDPMCATADDLPTGPGVITYTTCGLSPSTMGTQVLDTVTGCIVFTGNGTQTPNDTVKSCVVACKDGICDTTYINILTIVPDTVTVTPPCGTCPTDPICATANDLPIGPGTITYSTCGLSPTTMGTQVLDTLTGCIVFTGNGTQGANDTVKSCVVACKNGICDTTYINILPPINPDTVTVTTDCPTCSSDPICATADDLPAGPSAITYTTCGLSPSTMGTQVLDTVTGCIVFTGNGTQTPNDTVKSCVVACKDGICDTTYINILTIVPDTVIVVPPCGTCPTTSVCPTADDLPTTGANETYQNCGISSSDSTQGTLVVDPNGCAVWTPNGTQIDTISTCVVKCLDGLCDTTFVLIPPTNSTVPIEIVDFSGRTSGGRNVLHWTTATEINNNYFELYHGGSLSDLTELKTIPTKAIDGNSSRELSYQFVHINPLKGDNFYRLSNVDIDGQRDVHQTINLYVKENTTLAVYPNPVTDNLHLAFSNSDLEVVFVELTDITGKVVYKDRLLPETESFETEIPMSSLTNGMYLLRVSDDNGYQYIQKVNKK